jgi:hypothetical protein
MVKIKAAPKAILATTRLKMIFPREDPIMVVYFQGVVRVILDKGVSCRTC